MNCPLGESGCELREYRDGNGQPMGFRYGCIGAKAGKTRDTSEARFVPHLAAWVCSRAFFKHLATKGGKEKPDTAMCEHTRRIRAAFRTTQIERELARR